MRGLFHNQAVQQQNIETHKDNLVNKVQQGWKKQWANQKKITLYIHKEEKKNRIGKYTRFEEKRKEDISDFLAPVCGF